MVNVHFRNSNKKQPILATFRTNNALFIGNQSAKSQVMWVIFKLTDCPGSHVRRTLYQVKSNPLNIMQQKCQISMNLKQNVVQLVPNKLLKLSQNFV